MSEREIELKLVCQPAELERVKRAPALQKLKRGRGRGKHLHSVYFDTEKLVLGKNGFALRLRQNGADCIQTLKTEGDPSGEAAGMVASSRGEHEIALPRGTSSPDLNRLPASLRKQVQKLAKGGHLAPRLESDIRRTIHDLATPDGGRIELALDLGSLKAGARDEKVSEIELELKEGAPESLYRLALDLNEIATLRVGTMSKLARGMALLQGESPAAVKVETVHLPRGASLADAYATVLRHCLSHLMANESAMRDGATHLPGALHQARVALRRARSAFEIFEPVIGGEEARYLAREAKWLASELGPARDFDVFLTEILAPVRPEDAALARLRKSAETARAEHWEHARAVFASRRYTRFLLRYGLFLAARGWEIKADAPLLIRDFAAQALDRRLKKAVKLGHAIEKLEGEERHELRKRLKKLRYALHFFSSLYAEKEIDPWLRHLTRMQNVFGGLNDVATAHLILEELAETCSLKMASDRVAAWHGKRAEKEWKGAIQLWRRFEAAPPFWRASSR